jgi:hypothetical protein
VHSLVGLLSQVSQLVGFFFRQGIMTLRIRKAGDQQHDDHQ